MTNDDKELSTQETLRLFADIIESGKVGVYIEPGFLRDVADELDSALNDVIEIIIDGENSVVYEGKYATDIYRMAVTEFINNVLRREIERLEIENE